MSVEIDPFVTVAFAVKSSPLGRDVIFRVIVPTERIENEHDKLHAEAKLKVREAETFDATIKKMIEMGVRGWDEKTPYSFDEISGVLHTTDKINLAFHWPNAAYLSESDRGKSGSPPDVKAG